MGNSDVDLAVGQDGTLYFLTMGFDRSTSEGTHIAVGVSRDIGETWRWTTLSQDRFVDRPWIEMGPDGVVHVIWNDGEGVSYSVSRDAGETWVEPVAWDAEGTLYHLWSEGTDLWLGRSVDRGGTWESWIVVTGEVPLYFPYLTARGQGELAATWFSGFGDDLLAHVALIAASGEGQPSVQAADPFQIDAWVMDGDSPSRDSGGEYIPVRFLSDGDLGVVTPIQNPLENRRGFTWYRVF